jgi:tripartite-type tricarboxylate transporter receptor subunit TctC
MNLPRRQFFHLTAGAFAAPAIARHAVADAYPSRPVRLLVGFTPAGGNDIIARLMGQWLTERLGQTFVIENRPGAGTNIAAEVVINSPPGQARVTILNCGAQTIRHHVPDDDVRPQ